MTILYIIIVLLVLIVLLLSLILFYFSKKHFTDYDKKLILFVIDMYLSYGDSLDIFPDEKSKQVLIEKLNTLKRKIVNGEDSRKDNEKK